jgi:putative polyketide hydroxylase
VGARRAARQRAGEERRRRTDVGAWRRCTAEPADWQLAVTEATTAGLPVRIATLPAEATHTYGIGPTGAVLVRPDGYVAARWAASSDARRSPLVGTLTTILAA